MPDDYEFQGIITKLRTTRGSFYALGVMAEAADRIEADGKQITKLEAIIEQAPHGLFCQIGHNEIQRCNCWKAASLEIHG